MSNDKKVETMIENGVAQLIILEGKAPEQHNPQPVCIKGVITAVSDFIEKRKETFDPLKSHCMVSITEGKITLIVNEQSVVNKFTVEGKINIGKKLLELGINSGKSYVPYELSNKLRLMRSIFPSKGEHLVIVNTLKNFIGNINKQIEDLDDKRGNTTQLFKQTVQSNVPEVFTLNIPLIEGEEPVNVEVAVIMEASGSDVVCYLESVDGAEKIDEITIDLITKEVEKIKEATTVIYY